MIYVYHTVKRRAIVTKAYMKDRKGALCPGGETGVNISLDREGGKSDWLTWSGPSDKEPGKSFSLARDVGVSCDVLEEERSCLDLFLVDIAILRFAGIYTFKEGCERYFPKFNLKSSNGSAEDSNIGSYSFLIKRDA